MWHLQTGPKSKKWSESIRRIFSKRGTNQNCALLISDPRSIAHLQPKKYQIEQKVIIASIESWMEIGPWFWLIWIAPWLFWISVIFRGYIEVKVGPKTQILGASCLCLKSSFSRGFKRHLYNDEDYLCSKFQLNLTFFTGVIVPHRAPPRPPCPPPPL